MISRAARSPSSKAGAPKGAWACFAPLVLTHGFCSLGAPFGAVSRSSTVVSPTLSALAILRFDNCCSANKTASFLRFRRSWQVAFSSVLGALAADFEREVS